MDVGRVTIALELSIPQLTTLGDRLVDALSPISASVDRLVAVVEQEAAEIADELRRLQEGTPTSEQIGAVVARVDGLAERVRGFVTPAPPEEPLPEPDPAPEA